MKAKKSLLLVIVAVSIFSILIISFNYQQQKSLRNYEECVAGLSYLLEEQEANVQTMFNSLIRAVNFNIDSVKDFDGCLIRFNDLEPQKRIEKCRKNIISESSMKNELDEAYKSQSEYWSTSISMKNRMEDECKPKLKDYSMCIYLLAIISATLPLVKEIFFTNNVKKYRKRK